MQAIETKSVQLPGVLSPLVVHVFARTEVATGYFRRLVGLMGKREVEEGFALVFPKCTSVHTAFMRTDIDVVYLDSANCVLGYETLPPWKVSHAPRGVRNVLECAAGTCEAYSISPGERIGVCA